MTSPTSEEEGLSSALFRVEGTVQGVGYRWWTSQQAEELRIRGTVRNLPDGSVEVLAVGDASALGRLRLLLEHGPPGAIVERVIESPADPFPVPTDFAIQS